jgi:hypothetical protein
VQPHLPGLFRQRQCGRLRLRTGSSNASRPNAPPPTRRLLTIPPRNRPKKPKPISPNPNPLNQELGSFLHFAPTRNPRLSQRAASPPESSCNGPVPGPKTAEPSETSTSALLLSAAPGLPRNGIAGLARPGRPTLPTPGVGKLP